MSSSKGASAPAIRYRPIFGGPFGSEGRYVMATMPCIERGLHAVRHMVLEPRSGGVLSVSTSKHQALSDARRLLRTATSLAAREAANAPMMEQAGLWAAEELPSAKSAGVQVKAVPRRRREVFEKSSGRCFYCGTGLVIDGLWHIEHQMPRALMGADELPNLVAACAPCNLAKGDQTALEFLAHKQ
ncbi:MAG: HNH endonuclease [Rubrivivax sp.]|nr:MAG: HNH endonuclease [Rubrivivax sp.]